MRNDIKNRCLTDLATTQSPFLSQILFFTMYIFLPPFFYKYKDKCARKKNKYLYYLEKRKWERKICEKKDLALANHYVFNL